MDTFTGGAGNDVFNTAYAGLTTFDALDGGAGTDTLNIVETGNGVLASNSAISVANIETMSIKTAGSVGSTAAAYDVRGFSGLTSLSVTSLAAAADNIRAATTTDVSVKSADAVTVNGGNSVTVTATSGAVDVGYSLVSGTATAGTKAAGAVSVSTDASAVRVNGGTSVTVASAANVTIAAAKGDLLVTNTGTSASTGPVISLTGGAAVSVSTAGATKDTSGVLVSLLAPTTAGSVTVGAAGVVTTDATTGKQTMASTAPTGNVVINNSTTALDAAVDGVTRTYYGTNAVNVTTNGATSVTLSGGTVGAQTVDSSTYAGATVYSGAITDAQTSLLKPSTAGTAAAGTSTLSSVTLNGVSGAVAIASDALANLTITDSRATGGLYGQSAVTAVTVTNNTAAHGLNVTLANTASGTSVTDNKATSISVATGSATNNGSASSNITLSGSKLATVTFNNAASLTVGGITFDTTVGVVPSIVANNTGTLNLGSSAITGLKSINGSSATGSITATVDATATTFTGGSGNDTLTIAAVPTKALAGGAGTNTLVLNSAAATFASPIALNSNISGFTTLGLGSAATGTYDAVNFSGLSVAGNTTGAVTFSNVNAGTTLAVVANTQGVTYALQNNTTSDSLALSLGSAAATSAQTATAITATSIENLSINSLGNVAGGAFANVITTLTDANLKSLTVTGAAGLTISNDIGSNGGVLASIDTSGNTGAINLANVVTSTAGATFTTGSGSTTITGSAGLGSVDTINGGSGAVTFTALGVGGINATLGGKANSITATVATQAAMTITAGDGANTINVSGTSGVATITLGNGGTSLAAQTVTTGSGADVVSVGSGVNTINAGAGADRITFAADGATANVDTVVIGAANHTGVNAATSTSLSISTTSFDIVTGLTKGDKVDVAAVNNGVTYAAATNLAGGGNDTIVLAKGTFDAVAKTFTYSASGTDTLVTFDADATATIDYHSLVLVGYVTAASTAVSSGVLTLG